MLFAGLLVAAIIDLRTKQIPNALTGPLMLVGLAVATLSAPVALEGFLFGFYGWLAAFVLHFILWQLGLEGAGDAKLMMAVGAFVGWETMIEATFWRYVLLFPYALVALTVLGRWGNFRRAITWTMAKAQGVDVGDRPEPTKLPFGPVIAAAVPAAVYTDWLDFFA